MFHHQLEANANNKLFYQFRDQKPLSTHKSHAKFQKKKKNFQQQLFGYAKKLKSFENNNEALNMRFIFKWKTGPKTPRKHGVKWIAHLSHWNFPAKW